MAVGCSGRQKLGGDAGAGQETQQGEKEEVMSGRPSDHGGHKAGVCGLGQPRPLSCFLIKRLFLFVLI
jgi:hypothetical protein